jgi:hypothetical protein
LVPSSKNIRHTHTTHMAEAKEEETREKNEIT